MANSAHRRIEQAVKDLHKHTFEPHNLSEADIDFAAYIRTFNDNHDNRRKVVIRLRKLVKDAEGVLGLTILKSVDSLRIYRANLYRILGRGGPKKASDIPEPPIEDLDVLYELTNKDEFRPMVELLGGAYAILDYVRAQRLFSAKCHQAGLISLSRSQLGNIADAETEAMLKALFTLFNMFSSIAPTRRTLQLFLGNRRSFHELVFGIIKDSHAHNNQDILQVCCDIVYALNWTEDPDDVLYQQSYVRDCGIVKYLTELMPTVKDKETLREVLLALDSALGADARGVGQNCEEFYKVDGVIDFVIDVLVPSKEKDDDVANAHIYDQQRKRAVRILGWINCYTLRTDQQRPLMAKYRSRNIVTILVDNLKPMKLPQDKTTEFAAMRILEVLHSIFCVCDKQRARFASIEGASELVEGFKLAKNQETVDAANDVLAAMAVGVCPECVQELVDGTGHDHHKEDEVVHEEMLRLFESLLA